MISKEILEIPQDPRLDPDYLSAKRAVRKLSQSYDNIRNPEVRMDVPVMRRDNDEFERQILVEVKAKKAAEDLKKAQAPDPFSRS